MFRQFRICMVWFGLGMGKHCIALLETTENGKSFGLLARAHCIPCTSRGRILVYGFYPIAIQKMLENLNDPRFKRSEIILFVKSLTLHSPLLPRPNVNETTGRPPDKQP